MPLNKVKGNMYEFVDFTWNTVKGECYHNCSYCYMKKWGALPKIRFDEKELKTELGKDNFIFVGSSNDMFAVEVPWQWIDETIEHCKKFNNKYLFQSKNPSAFLNWEFPARTVLGTTVESNRNYPEISDAPLIENRFGAIKSCKDKGFETMLTIEPILDFDLDIFVELLKFASPTWVNIGADSSGHGLPEPDPGKVRALIDALSFTDIKIKKNLGRLVSG